MAKGKDRLCLIAFNEDLEGTEMMEIMLRHQKEVMEKLGFASERKIAEVLFVFKNLSGAIYCPRTIDIDQWEKTEWVTGAGRVSLVFHPMYMEHQAIREYLALCQEEDAPPLILAHASTIAERRINSDTSTVGRLFFGVRQVLEEIAAEQSLSIAEFKYRDIVKI
jgi:hypothetical protein